MVRNRKKTTTIASFSSLTGITVIEKVLSFVFQATIAAVLGASMITDSYFSASELFTLVDNTLIGALTVVMLNKYAHICNTEGEESAFNFLSDVQSVVFPIIFGLCALILIFAKPLSFVIAPGYDAQCRAILVRCIRIMSFAPLIVSVTSIGQAVLRQKKHFVITALKSLFISVIGIASVVIFGKRATNADPLSIAFVISMLLFCLVVRFATGKYGKTTLHKPENTSELKDAVKMVVPLMLSNGIIRLGLMVDRIIASFLGKGTVSSLTYSHTLYNCVEAIFIANICMILLTDFNNLQARNEIGAMKKKLENAISTVALALIPITIISIICHEDIVKIVFERGAFSKSNTAEVAMLLAVYAIGFLPAAITSVCNQVLYSFGDTKTPMQISMIAIGTNIAVSVILAFQIGIVGTAVGTVTANFLDMTLKTRAVRKLIPGFNVFKGNGYIGKMIPASLACILVVLAVKFIFTFPALLTFVVSTALGFGALLAVLLILKEETTAYYCKAVLSKIKR